MIIWSVQDINGPITWSNIGSVSERIKVSNNASFGLDGIGLVDCLLVFLKYNAFVLLIPSKHYVRSFSCHSVCHRSIESLSIYRCEVQ